MAVVGVFPAKITAAQEESTLPTLLAPFEVTGSRIDDADIPASLFVQHFTADEMAQSGQATIADFLRALPWNTGGSYTPANAVALNAGQTGLNLRGLGANNTLVLLNGRRLALFGQADGNTLAADLGNLPAAAVESVEVLRGGASALYGSDAIAGVVNVKLARSYEGGRLRASFHQFFDTDWGRYSADFTYGIARDDGSLLVVCDYAESNDVRFSDRPISRTEDLREMGGRDLRQNFGWPGQVFIRADLATAPEAARGGFATVGTVDRGIVTIAPPTRTPRAEDFVRLPPNLTDGRPTVGASQSNFDRAPYTNLIPTEKTWGFYASLERTLTPHLVWFSELAWRRRLLSTSLHPTPAGTSLESASGVGDGPGGSIIFPRQHPYNPFGVDLPLLQFQLVELGPRIRQFTNVTPRGLVGLRGTLGMSWHWEAALLHSANTVREDTRNYITDADLQAGLSGRLGGFLNPFGPSDPGVIDRARTGLHAKQSFRTTLGDAHVRGDWLTLPAGPLRTVFGVEIRRDDYRGEPDELAAQGAYVAWSALTRMHAGRNVRAVFGELAAPLTPALRVRGAARAEDYSDFGRTIRPAMAIDWAANPWLALHAVRAEAFKAPELLDLYATQTETYATIDDPHRPDLGSYTVRYRTGGNPGLQPEESVSWHVGATAHTSGDDGLALGATWWRIEKSRMVGSLGLPFLLGHEIDPVFPTAERIVRSPTVGGGPPGEIVLVNDTRGNIDAVTTSGWDFDLTWHTPTSGSGKFRATVSLSWLREWTFLSRNSGAVHRVGTDSLPEWRGRGALQWQHAPWQATLSADWIGHHDGGGINHLGGSTTQHARAFFNLHVARTLLKNWKIAASVTNLFDTDPPIHFASSRGYSTSVYDNHGRGYGVSVDREF